MGILTSLAALKYLLTPSRPTYTRPLTPAEIEEIDRINAEAANNLAAFDNYIHSTNIYHICDSTLMWITENLVMSNAWLYFLIATVALFIVLVVLAAWYDERYMGEPIEYFPCNLVYYTLCASLALSLLTGAIKLLIWLLSPVSP